MIVVDKKGKEQIEGLCNIALRVGGLPNLAEVNQILDSMEITKEKPKKRPKNEDKT